MFLDNSCTPWFFPTPPGTVTKPCDPWQTQQFIADMAAVPDDQGSIL